MNEEMKWMQLYYMIHYIDTVISLNWFNIIINWFNIINKHLLWLLRSIYVPSMFVNPFMLSFISNSIQIPIYQSIYPVISLWLTLCDSHTQCVWMRSMVNHIKWYNITFAMTSNAFAILNTQLILLLLIWLLLQNNHQNVM